MPTHRVPNMPGKSNWVQEMGGLPPAIENVAGAILDDPTSGIKDVSRAIGTAISRAKVWAAKGNAKYVKAVAQWEKMKAKAAVKKDGSPIEVEDVLAIPIDDRRALVKSFEIEDAIAAGPPPAEAPSIIRKGLFGRGKGGFDEEAHPRWPKGTPGIGGRFCPNGMPGESIRLASMVLGKLNNDNKQHADLAQRFQSEAKAVDWKKESNPDMKTRELLQRNIVEPLAGKASGDAPGGDFKPGDRVDVPKTKEGWNRPSATVDHVADDGTVWVKMDSQSGRTEYEQHDAADLTPRPDLDPAPSDRDTMLAIDEDEKRAADREAQEKMNEGGLPGADIREVPLDRIYDMADNGSDSEKQQARRELSRRGKSLEGRPGKANADGKDPWLGGEDGGNTRGLSDEAKRKRAEGVAAAVDEDTDKANEVASKLKREEEAELPGGYTLEHGAEGGWILWNPHDKSSDQGSKSDVIGKYSEHREKDLQPGGRKKGTTKDGLTATATRYGEGGGDFPGLDAEEKKKKDDAKKREADAKSEAESKKRERKKLEEDAKKPEPEPAMTPKGEPVDYNRRSEDDPRYDNAARTRAADMPKSDAADETFDIREAKQKVAGLAVGDSVDLGFGMRVERTGDNEYRQFFPDGDDEGGLKANEVVENAEDEAVGAGAEVKGGITGPVADMDDSTLESNIRIVRQELNRAKLAGDKKRQSMMEEKLKEANAERKARRSVPSEETLGSMSTEDLEALASGGGPAAAAARAELDRRAQMARQSDISAASAAAAAQPSTPRTAAQRRKADADADRVAPKRAKNPATAKPENLSDEQLKQGISNLRRIRTSPSSDAKRITARLRELLAEQKRRKG